MKQSNSRFVKEEDVDWEERYCVISYLLKVFYWFVIFLNLASFLAEAVEHHWLMAGTNFSVAFGLLCSFIASRHT